MLFTRHTRPDGGEAVTVDCWDQEAQFSAAFLMAGDPAMVQVEGDTIHIQVENGWADYQITSRDGATGLVKGWLTRSFIDGEG